MNIKTINPTEKDFERAKGLEFRKQFGRITFHGNSAPWQCEAEKMAKLIKNPEKLIRRAKAIVATWGTGIIYSGDGESQNVWEPFKNALKNLGFNNSEIREISIYKK
jgi:hypothetical protein